MLPVSDGQRGDYIVSRYLRVHIHNGMFREIDFINILVILLFFLVRQDGDTT